MTTLTQHPRGDSRDHRAGRHVAGDDRPRADQRSLADFDPAKDHGAAAQRRSPADESGRDPPVGFGLQRPVGGRPGIGIVDEEDAVPHEHLVLDRHALAEKRVALDLAPRAHDDVLLDLDEGPDPRLIADPAAVEVNEPVQDDVSPQLDVRGDPIEVRPIR